MRLKKESGELGSSTGGTRQAISHAEVLGGAKAKKTSFSIEKHRFRKNTSVDNVTGMSRQKKISIKLMKPGIFGQESIFIHL